MSHPETLIAAHVRGIHGFATPVRRPKRPTTGHGASSKYNPSDNSTRVLKAPRARGQRKAATIALAPSAAKTAPVEKNAFTGERPDE